MKVIKTLFKRYARCKALLSGSQSEKEVQSHFRKSIDSSSDNSSLPFVLFSVFFCLSSEHVGNKDGSSANNTENTLGLQVSNPPNETVGEIQRRVRNPCFHIYLPSPWRPCTADKADSADTHELPHIASEPTDANSYYLKEIGLRTAKEGVQ